MMPAGTYRAWLVEDEGAAIVAGGGITILPWPPGPRYPGDRIAFVFNVYTEPAHRRRGIGRLVMDAIHAWCARARRHVAGAEREHVRPVALRIARLSRLAEPDDVSSARRVNAMPGTVPPLVLSQIVETQIERPSPIRQIMKMAERQNIIDLGLNPDEVISFGGGWVNHEAPEALRAAYDGHRPRCRAVPQERRLQRDARHGRVPRAARGVRNAPVRHARGLGRPTSRSVWAARS